MSAFKKHPRSSTPGGFTLVEVLATVLLLAIALLGFYQGQAGSAKLSRRSEMRAQAYYLAQQKMTEIELQLKNKNFQALPDEEKGEFKEEEFKAFRWVRKLEPIEVGCFLPTPPEGEDSGFYSMAKKIFGEAIRKIRVTVVWEENKKIQKAVLSQLYVRWDDLPSF